IFSHLKSPNWKRKISFSLHSKIVLRTAIALTLFFTVLFWLLERNSTLANMSPGLAIVNSIFNSIGARSAGFVTIPIVNLQLASILIVLVACFIGSAPGSTGSGIKTTTFSIFMSTLKSAITGKLAVEMYGRTIPRHQVLKAFAVLALSISWIIFAVFCLLITERSWSFLTVLFEVVSAFSTLGLSMLGKTADFTLTGKLILVITMIIGRIGPLTTVLALKKPSEKQEFSYPEERVMIG
ncbi:Trk family potassium uptake protein, partial [bacterium]|nr:Trk family potassium uptake protein [bacterium]